MNSGCVSNRSTVSLLEFSLQNKVTKQPSSLLSQCSIQSKYLNALNTLNLQHIQDRDLYCYENCNTFCIYLNYRKIQGSGIATPTLLLAFSKFPEQESQEISQAAERMEMSIQVLKQKVCQRRKRSLHPTGKYSVLTLANHPIDLLNAVF